MRIKLAVSTPQLAAGIFKRKLAAAFEVVSRDAAPRVRALVVDRLSVAADRAFDKSGAGAYRAELRKPSVVKLDLKGVEVAFENPFVVALEKGGNAFDMKQKLLARAKRFSKSGVPYVDVPFKHPGSSVPRADKRALLKTARASGGGDARLSRRTPGRSFTRTLVGGGFFGLRDSKQKVKHKRGLRDDLVRSKKGGRASFSTVRRLSAKSSPSSWWHPGFRGAGLVGKVFKDIKPDVVAILRDSLRSRGVRLK